MVTDSLQSYLNRLRAEGLESLSDSELVERFVMTCDEVAFTGLVQRHGPLVLGVCRRILKDTHLAEDAFQTVFMILARKAGSIRKRMSVASWVYGVALRVARKARQQQRQTSPLIEAPDKGGASDSDLLACLDEELERLPAKYRLPLILCYLEGRTNKEAARLLECSEDAIRGRLYQGLKRLRSRLIRFGTWAPAGLDRLASQGAFVVPETSLIAAVKTSCAYAKGDPSWQSAVSMTSVFLERKVSRTMIMQKIQRTVIVSLIVGLLLGTIGFGMSPWQQDSTKIPEQTPAPSGQQVAPVPKRVRADKQKVIQGNNAFAFAVYNELRGEKGNLFLSPYGISMGLSMALGGARGETAEQMKSALRYPIPSERLPEAFSLLRQETKADTKNGYKLRIANAVWMQSGYAFRPEFVALCADHYGALAQPLDFGMATEQARQRINRWTADRTSGDIPELYKKGTLSNNTKLVLTNAIAFQGKWTTAFNKKKTRDSEFRISAKESISVPVMHQEGTFRVLFEETFSAVELPYGDGGMSMLIFVPNTVDGLAKLEARLTEKTFAEWHKKFRKEEMLVTVPRIKFRSSFELGKPLIRLGMTNAFQSGQADFSGMDGTKGLSINSVLHRAFVEIDEKGTKAAAVTGIQLSDPSGPPSVRADKPFFFLIRDNRTGSVLFLGRVVDPRGT